MEVIQSYEQRVKKKKKMKTMNIVSGTYSKISERLTCLPRIQDPEKRKNIQGGKKLEEIMAKNLS